MATSQPIEEWRPVVGYEDRYLVSSEGRIYSIPRQDTMGRQWGDKILSPSGAEKYLTIGLHVDGIQATKRVHELIAEAFIGLPPAEMEVRHLDGDPRNNRLTNLCYGTRVENAQDSLQHGTNRNARKTHCKYGHEFDEANTHIRRNGNRACRACYKKQAAEWYVQNRKGVA